MGYRKYWYYACTSNNIADILIIFVSRTKKHCYCFTISRRFYFKTPYHSIVISMDMGFSARNQLLMCHKYISWYCIFIYSNILKLLNVFLGYGCLWTQAHPTPIVMFLRKWTISVSKLSKLSKQSVEFDVI